MEKLPKAYKLFFDFIDQYLPDGFHNVDPGSPLMLDMEEMMEANNQFFFIADQLNQKVLFCSKRSSDFIGIAPEKIDPVSFLNSVHPSDLNRLKLVRTKIFNLSGELYLAKKGIAIISTTLRFQKSPGTYTNQLVQCFLFYKELPSPVVYRLQVSTDISEFRKIMHGNHYYVGDDLFFFRYPDPKLLHTGSIFSNRESEIIKLISEGYSSEQIANMLFLSANTIYTHRRNILKKSDKSTIMDLILDLEKRGLL